MSLQTEVLPALKNDQAPQADHKAVCGIGHFLAQVALLFGETLLGTKISNNIIHYYFKIRHSFLTQFCRFQIKDAQSFPVEEGPGETVLIGRCCDGVTWNSLFDCKSCAKNLDEILGMTQDADLPLDLGGLLVGRVSKDWQLTNSSVLCGRLHLFIHQVFETDAEVPDLFLVQSQLSRADFPYSLRAMRLVMKGTRKEKKELDFFFLNPVDLMKSLVAICVLRFYGLCAL